MISPFLSSSILVRWQDDRDSALSFESFRKPSWMPVLHMASSPMLLLSAGVVFSHLPVQGTEASSWTLGSIVPPSSGTSYSSSSLWAVGNLQMPKGTCIVPVLGQEAAGPQDSLTQGVSLTGLFDICRRTQGSMPNAHWEFKHPWFLLDSLCPNFIFTRA